MTRSSQLHTRNSGDHLRHWGRALAGALLGLIAVVVAMACGDDDAPKPAQPSLSPTTMATTSAASPTAVVTTTVATPTVATTPTPQPATAKKVTEKLTVGAAQREALVYVPASAPSAKAPAIIMLHAPGTVSGPNGGANAVSEEARFGILMGAEADQKAFIAVFPKGTQLDSSPVSCCNFNDGRPTWGSQAPPDDIAFFNALLDMLVAKYSVDPNRISFTGYGPGAAMTYKVACEMSDRVAAIAPVNSGGNSDTSACTKMAPLSVQVVHGTANPNAPYAGGVNPNNGQVAQAIPDVIAYWRTFDSCTGDGAQTQLTAKTPDRRYGPCKGGTDVSLIAVQDGGFCWWGATPPPLPPSSGTFCGAGTPGDPDLKLTPVVVDFLLKQTRAAR